MKSIKRPCPCQTCTLEKGTLENMLQPEGWRYSYFYYIGIEGLSTNRTDGSIVGMLTAVVYRSMAIIIRSPQVPYDHIWTHKSPFKCGYFAQRCQLILSISESAANGWRSQTLIVEADSLDLSKKVLLRHPIWISKSIVTCSSMFHMASIKPP